MKVVILAGGFGTRLSEETDLKPKPMLSVGEMPILWHIMKIYSSHGFNEFVILLGYKGYVIKEYFSNYILHSNNITIDLQANKTHIINETNEPWKITLLETGLKTMTGGRIAQAKNVLDGERFLLTYGDGLGDVDIKALIEHHERSNTLMTLTACQPAGRFGALGLNNANLVTSFKEKPQLTDGWINGGFFVFENNFFKIINKKVNVMLERQPLESLTKKKELIAFKHNGFWQCMDTLRDYNILTKLNKFNAPWKE